MDGQFFKNIPLKEIIGLDALVSYAEGRVESRTLAQFKEFNVTLFAFDKGEGISTHSAAGDAMVTILDGKADITIGDDPVYTLKKGESIVMPAHIPHGLEATEQFKMLLVVVKKEHGK